MTNTKSTGSKKPKSTKSIVRRLRDELSGKLRHEQIWSVNQAHAAPRNALYQVQLAESLHRHLQPSLLRLDDAAHVDKATIFESAKVDAALRLSRQLYMLEFSFRKLSLRWRRIKLASGLRLWQHHVALHKAHDVHVKVLTFHAIRIQRAYRRRFAYVRDLAAKKSLADQLHALLQEHAAAHAQRVREELMATQLQRVWRGTLTRLRVADVLAAQLRRTLCTLSVHQLFGHLKPVQVAAGHLFLTLNAEAATIEAAHDVLMCPPAASQSLLLWTHTIRDIAAIAEVRASRHRFLRAKVRTTYWQLQEALVADMALQEWRHMQRNARREARRHARTEHLERQRDATRATRALLLRQALQAQLEAREAADMTREDELMHAVMAVWRAWDQKLASDRLKHARMCLKLQLQSRAAAVTATRRELDAMLIEDDHGRCARLNRHGASVAMHWQSWQIHITIQPMRGVVVHHLAAVTVIYRARRLPALTEYVYSTSNALDLKQGLLRPSRYQLPTVLMPSDVSWRGAVNRCLYRVCWHRHEKASLLVHATRMNANIVVVAAATIALPSVLALLTLDQMVWLRPRHHIKLFRHLATCTAIDATSHELVVTPPLHVTQQGGVVHSAVPVLNALLHCSWTTFQHHLDRIEGLCRRNLNAI
ncbi:hypothetical protein SPRG_01902 [Saprolegnia parasitica CBS 223.65]|uniref:Uncharacterized protein n=1 Tax=Saprolegnia parasitica (strain CBS 223.65) TaxID=695850 RepID=A0A067CQW2_SAPPC|nr:hypothetical protein SPRG_01902 [Saprolegnia parasitica CBS 223.65]KDO33089.1 hypothetical protein SPRG_01902 [Saprolegnia parasitica CBS 223.65]|eukprot:XP_012195858.1 hypothetical protein SPRG_01902 [Saprolegnia parasitica CBS 223.65]